ncbi:MBL fold metallo-hydrolase [Sphingomonas sp. MMSM20]|uniref:MBL fold metallo-hydrolase n=1 Tax=Sphingomonas lycopersici TaxID=2951807 RepID=UPI0022390891|nr:MBL fold metallo-hydrolase [Sphingomonas lycopersici]MCW6530776.1 MBL fold metallo-hydrolase [Sphingomonas lycopersici]
MLPNVCSGGIKIFGALALIMSCCASTYARAQQSPAASDAASAKPGVPDIAPIGVPVAKFLDIPEAARGPRIDPSKGFRIEKLGEGLYLVTDSFYQSMFMVYETGVVVVDAPPSYAGKIGQAIASVTNKPVTHLIYSHAHIDHIGGAGTLGGHPIVIAQDETARLLRRAADPDRPLPTVTFAKSYTLKVGSQLLELSYPGNGHEPGNIQIYAPAQKTLMYVDVVFPGWIPFRRFGVAQDVPGYFQQVRDLDRHPFEKLVGGHVNRIGTHADVKLQIAFDDDIKAAVGAALKSQPFGAVPNSADAGNQWAVIADYTGRVARTCVATMTPRWKDRIAGFDTFIWDQCYAMEQSLRVD